MKQNIVIVGAGGFGSEVAWLLEDSNFQNAKYQLKGFVDDDPECQGEMMYGYPVVGTVEWLSQITEDICVAIAIGHPAGRFAIYNRLKKNPHISFPTLLAATAKCASSATLGDGCIICHGGLVMPHSTVGNFVTVNDYGAIGHHAVIGDFCAIGPVVQVCGHSVLGAFCDIGVKACVIENKTLGDNVTLGAGAIAVRDIPSNSLAVGVPAKVIKQLDK